MLHVVQTSAGNGKLRCFFVITEEGELISDKLKQILTENLVDNSQVLYEFDKVAPDVYEDLIMPNFLTPKSK